MNLGEMRTEVRDIIGEETADFWEDAELNRYLNEAQRRFTGENRWSWLITEGTAQLDGGDPELQLVEGVHDYRHLNFLLTREGDTRPYRPMKVTPKRGMELREAYYTSAAYPQWFYVVSIEDSGDDGAYQTTVRFIPTPSGTVDVDYHYYRTPATMDGDTDVPDVPVDYHKALVHYAAGTAWLKEMNSGKAQEQFNLYDSIVIQAKDDEESAGDDQPVIVGGNTPIGGPVVMSAHDYTLRRITPTLGS